jgi:hypothetical protein
MVKFNFFSFLIPELRGHESTKTALIFYLVILSYLSVHVVMTGVRIPGPSVYSVHLRVCLYLDFPRDLGREREVLESKQSPSYLSTYSAVRPKEREHFKTTQKIKNKRESRLLDSFNVLESFPDRKFLYKNIAKGLNTYAGNEFLVPSGYSITKVRVPIE